MTAVGARSSRPGLWAGLAIGTAAVIFGLKSAGAIDQGTTTLLATIPLVLMHALLASMAKGVTTVLEEQSTGLIATQSEAEGAGRPGVDRA